MTWMNASVDHVNTEERASTLSAAIGTRKIQIQVLTEVIWEDRVPLAQLCNKVPFGFNGTPQIHPQNCSFTFDDHRLHLIHSSLDRPHSSTQTASRSSQPFCHSTLVGHTQSDRPTDRQTERWDRRQVYTVSAYARYIDRERRANNNY